MTEEENGEVQQEEVLTEEQIEAFIVAAHGNLPRVREMLILHPGLINARHYWTKTDSETAIQAAAQTGSVPVVEYLLEHGEMLLEVRRKSLEKHGIGKPAAAMAEGAEKKPGARRATAAAA